MNEQIPVPTLVSDQTWSLPLANPHRHMPFTLCYIIRGDDETLLIDPGWGSDDNFAYIDRALRTVGRAMSDVSRVVITHLHPDHLGLAERVRSASGASVLMHSTEQARVEANAAARTSDLQRRETLTRWGVPQDHRADVESWMLGRKELTTRADILLDEGSCITWSGPDLRVLHTPGHTPGHMCLAQTDTKTIFVGDHVLPRTVPGVGLGGGDEAGALAKYLDSLSRMRDFDSFLALPGHEYIFRNLAERAREIVTTYETRRADAERIAAELDDATPWNVARHFPWRKTWEEMAPHRRLAALRQIALLLGSGSAPDVRQ